MPKPAISARIGAPRPCADSSDSSAKTAAPSASAGQDLAVAWTGSSADNVTVQLTSGTTASSAVARCAFAGNAGAGTVPAGAISAVVGVGGNTSIIVMSESRMTIQPDGWNIAFSKQFLC